MAKKRLVGAIFILLFIFLFFSISLFAETITLNSGYTVEGKILKRADKYIKVDHGNGMLKLYKLDEIESIDGKKLFTTKGKFTPNDIIKLLGIISLLGLGSINFICLFVWEAYPGIGHFSFSVRDVSLRTRVLVFILSSGCLSLPGYGKMFAIVPFSLLVFGKK